MKKQLQSRFAKIVSKLIPIQAVRQISDRHEPLTTISHLDADTMAGILQEAEDGYTERLFTLYRDIMVDSHLLAEFSKRKLAVLKEIPAFSPEDKETPEDEIACEEIKSLWSEVKGKREALTHLLDSTLYPVALIEKVWRVSNEPGRIYDLDRLIPVPHHLLDYRDGCLKVRKIGEDGRPIDQWQKPEPSRYIIHRGHLLTSFPDKWGGPMRAILFWWLFKTMNREWWARFLDRFGSPFLVGKYNDGDDRSRAELAHAFREATRIFGLTIPTAASVEMVQAATSQTGDAFEKFHSVANAEISKLIVGQTMTTEATAGGIGGTQAQVHQAVRDDIQGFDSAALSETLRDQLFRQHLLINGTPGSPPHITFGGQGEADAKAIADYLKALKEIGLEPEDDALEYLSRAGGFNIRRVTVPTENASVSLGVDDPTSQLAGNAAAMVSQKLRDKHASLPEIIANSATSEDLEERLIAHFREGNQGAANAIADVLATHALNGLDRSA